MKRRAFLGCGAVAAALILGGCATTGDPTQGGLFGWSEAKAKERLAEKQTALAEEEAAMHSEQRQEGALRGTVQTNAGEIAAQEREIGALLANAEALEQEAPTPADASRARRLRRGIERIRGNTGFSPEVRWSMLRDYAEEVDRLRVDWAGASAAVTPR